MKISVLFLSALATLAHLVRGGPAAEPQLQVSPLTRLMPSAYLQSAGVIAAHEVPAQSFLPGTYPSHLLRGHVPKLRSNNDYVEMQMANYHWGCGSIGNHKIRIRQGGKTLSLIHI